jgi:GNAT superfamily N-acetyltransferase
MLTRMISSFDAYGPACDGVRFDRQQIARDNADAHFVSDIDGLVTARCSIWADCLPDLHGRKTGAVGHFAAADELSAGRVLRAACEELGRRGCRSVVGPMDGSTWKPYRLVTDAGHLPPFFLEPWNPPAWPEYFESVGFSPIARYVSEINDDIAANRPVTGILPAEFERMGIQVRTFDLAMAGDLLNGIYDVASVAFQNAFLYTPIDRQMFMDAYRQLLPQVNPKLVLVASRNGVPVGFVFAVRDWLQGSDGQAIDTIVIKTIAVLPDTDYRGLGRVLIVRLLQNAGDLGFRRAVSALMHVDNRSQKISADCAGPMREYTLYGMELA